MRWIHREGDVNPILLVALWNKFRCCLSIPWPRRCTMPSFSGRSLNVFCSDGVVPIDNNVSEREMKRVVLNLKTRCSWIFGLLFNFQLDRSTL
jgi:hypothetical protein